MFEMGTGWKKKWRAVENNLIKSGVPVKRLRWKHVAKNGRLSAWDNGGDELEIAKISKAFRKRNARQARSAVLHLADLSEFGHSKSLYDEWQRNGHHMLLEAGNNASIVHVLGSQREWPVSKRLCLRCIVSFISHSSFLYSLAGWRAAHTPGSNM